MININDILVNLKVLENVQVNQKLISKGKYLNIEYDSIVPLFIRRWIRQDNRDIMVSKITIIITEAVKLKNNNDNNNILKEYLQNSIKGLKNLKETYKYCSQTCAQIDILIDTINR